MKSIYTDSHKLVFIDLYEDENKNALVTKINDKNVLIGSGLLEDAFDQICEDADKESVTLTVHTNFISLFKQNNQKQFLLDRGFILIEEKIKQKCTSRIGEGEFTRFPRVVNRAS